MSELDSMIRALEYADVNIQDRTIKMSMEFRDEFVKMLKQRRVTPTNTIRCAYCQGKWDIIKLSAEDNNYCPGCGAEL